MTGIERLYKLIADIDVNADPGLWYILRGGTEGDWDCEEHDDKTLDSTLAAIADQIKREQSCDRDTTENVRLIVGGVVDDMERHVSGVEGAEDSPVARWARELREALGGDGRDHAADVSVSAYDLLPADEREAIAWVREHGGLDAVERRWECLSYYADPVPRSCMERRLARLQRQIDESHAALRRRNQRIEELNHRACDLTRENAELRKRTMPEGMEWPTFESGEPVMLGDSVVKYVGGGEFEVRSIEFRDGVTYLREGFRTEGIVLVRSGERVKRPAPKVLDADGVEIRVGDRVWSTQLDEPHEWIVINPHEDRGYAQTVLVSIGDRTGHARPENLTHRAPVLAADGVPLEVGQTVWHVATGRKYTVRSCTNGGAHLSRDGKPAGYCRAEYLTHQRPVLDADGVPIKKGDTVYLLPGEWCDEWPCCGFHGGEELEVFADGEASHVPGSVQCREKEKRFGFHGTCYPKPSQLTHTKPEIDTWQRIEEDSTLSPEVYCHRNGIDISQKDGTEIFLADTVEPMARDLVRRCRALAERERGE